MTFVQINDAAVNFFYFQNSCSTKCGRIVASNEDSSFAFGDILIFSLLIITVINSARDSQRRFHFQTISLQVEYVFEQQLASNCWNFNLYQFTREKFKFRLHYNSVSVNSAFVNRTKPVKRTRTRTYCQTEISATTTVDEKETVVSMVRAARHQFWHSLPSYLIYSSIHHNRKTKNMRFARNNEYKHKFKCVAVDIENLLEIFIHCARVCSWRLLLCWKQLVSSKWVWHLRLLKKKEKNIRDGDVFAVIAEM